MTNNKYIELKPRYLLDENWKPINMKINKSMEIFQFELYDKLYYKESFIEIQEEMDIKDLIRSTRIEIAEAAESKKIFSEGEYDYLESEIGMNIILPKGNIAEMRFHVTLLPEDRVVAVDGFPRDVIETKEIVGGKIKIGISKAFKFIPVVKTYIGELLEIELNPWEFKLGSIKSVKVDFSGGLTSRPEWYFKKDGIKNELRVALIIKKPKSIGAVEGKVRAAWLYDPGFIRFKKNRRFGTDEKEIKIFSE